MGRIVGSLVLRNERPLNVDAHRVPRYGEVGVSLKRKGETESHQKRRVTDIFLAMVLLMCSTRSERCYID